MLAVAAAATERIHVDVGVMVLALRDPVWAAKQLATLQHVSGGPVVLGVGAACTAPRHGRPSASPTPNVAAAPTRRSRSCRGAAPARPVVEALVPELEAG